MKTALILVDIQNDYFKGGQMELVGMDEAGTKAGRLLSYFRENDLSTFHIQHVASDPGLGFFLPNTDGVELHDSIKPLPGEPVIQKHYPNGFRETVLGEELSKAGVGRVVVCGAMSHMCIDATTRAAADSGLECVLVHDTCATRDLEFEGRTIPAREVHDSFMASLSWAYAKALTLDELVSDSNTDDMR